MTVSAILRCAALVTLTLTCHCLAFANESAERDNIALGKPYTLHPAPRYSYCTDPGDRTQLTDGKQSEGYFWTHKATVGWSSTGYASITIDLSKIEPIAGITFRTAAGTAGVHWPTAVHIHVSDDGKVYRDVGDLVTLSAAEHLLQTAADQVLAASGCDSIDWHSPKDRTVADMMRIALLQKLADLQEP